MHTLTFYNEVKEELDRLFQYWATEAINPHNRLFYGSINYKGDKNPEANLGIIMYSRLLWSFSAAAKHYNSNPYKEIAQTCYNTLESYFYDNKHGGYFWECTVKGEIVDHKKQTYAQAFALYALCEYYSLTTHEEIKLKAEKQFQILTCNCFDSEFGGYLEGFTQDWKFDKKNRLSEKDQFAEKTMNTNLHVLEALTLYYKIFKTNTAKTALKRVVLDFYRFIVDHDNHLILFMDRKWKKLHHIHSYGHDVEAAWMLWEAAELLDDEALLLQIKTLVIEMTDTFILEGIDHEAVIHEKNMTTKHLDEDRHWWPQCEALEGLANAYAISKNEQYLDKMALIWSYIKLNFIDYENGEWHTRISAKGKIYENENKGGMWKTPYHNGRALMKLVQRFRV